MNKNLNNAKKVKNDEFYTQMGDIEKELPYYKEQFKNKIVYCNCDTELSNFYLYFKKNFNNLKLKKLIITNKDNYKIELTKKGIIKSKLNGDFRSCIDLLKESDIVCTNPPFSLFREYVDLLIKYDKKFLIIGNYAAITYKEIFKLIKDNQLWLGYTPRTMKFLTTDNKLKSVNASWFTNLNVEKHYKTLKLSKSYYENTELYPKYDNYDAINVDRIKDIPIDYDGPMGVPITFLQYYNPKHFEIVGIDRYIIDNPNYGKRFTIDKREIYARIVIRKIKFEIIGQSGIIEPDGICIKYKGGRPYINDKRMYSRIFIKKVVAGEGIEPSAVGL